MEYFMTPKSETMWMAWGKSAGFNPYFWGETQYICQRKINYESEQPEVWTPIQVTIQPKKRGKG